MFSALMKSNNTTLRAKLIDGNTMLFVRILRLALTHGVAEEVVSSWGWSAYATPPIKGTESEVLILTGNRQANTRFTTRNWKIFVSKLKL
jgi:hypothetical protein